MTRALRIVLASVFVVSGALAVPGGRAQSIADAITELDVIHAKELLDKTDSDSPTLSFERARLAIYVGDCDTAAAILSSPSLANTPEGAGLAELAKSCAGATAASVVVEDEKHGVWVRLQDERDRVLVPIIVDVASKARARIGADLGSTLPRPLRIDLVRDLFSLSAVSGLPLQAAETTGTVAVARWGRVTMISPRATALGFPWEDTLAHEITHLTLSRATRDRAPLWLQEGIAKREETRWRPAEPFDATPSPDETARQALLTGRSVGIDKLGPSIAMLPTPEAASIAFAEVTSFMEYWIHENGTAALALLLADLKGLSTPDPSAAMRSVTGYDLSFWILRWRKYLRELPEPKHEKTLGPHGSSSEMGEVARRLRLGDLLFNRGYPKAAAEQLAAGVAAVPDEAILQFRAARALAASGDEDQARETLGTLKDIRAVHGGWFALHGRWQRPADPKAAERSFGLAVAVDPLSETVACEGVWTPRVPPGAKPGPVPPLPHNAARRGLCEDARKSPQN